MLTLYIGVQQEVLFSGADWPGVKNAEAVTGVCSMQTIHSSVVGSFEVQLAKREKSRRYSGKVGCKCSLPLWRVHEIKRTYLASHIHGLFIT